MDLFDARDEGLGVLRPIDARGDERPGGPHFARREFAVLPPDLEDSLVIPSALLLARVAVRGLDANPDLEILDRGQLLEPARRLDPDGEVVRVLLPCDVGEAEPFIGSEGRHRLAEQLRDHQVAIRLRPAGPETVRPAGLTARDVDELDRRDDRMPFPEAVRAEAFVDRAFRPALDAEHGFLFSIRAALLKCWCGRAAPDIRTEGHKYPSARRLRGWRRENRLGGACDRSATGTRSSSPSSPPRASLAGRSPTTQPSAPLRPAASRGSTRITSRPTSTTRRSSSSSSCSPCWASRRTSAASSSSSADSISPGAESDGVGSSWDSGWA